jgi:hypothetical protein
MRTRTSATMEREEMRVVARGDKPCRARRVAKKNASIMAASRPTGFERQFWPFAGSVVLIWVLLRVFDFTLLPLAHRARGAGSALKIKDSDCRTGVDLVVWEYGQTVAG